jgi:plastocyanin
MKLVQSMGIFFLLTIFLVFTGCSDDEVTLESISITPSNPSVAENSPLDLDVEGTFSDGTVKEITSVITWTPGATGDTGTATIDSSGLVTGGNDGTVTITATVTIDGVPHSDSETLTVISSTGSVSIVVGATDLCTGAYDLDTITVALDANSNATVTWTNNDTVLHNVISTDDTGTTCTPSGGTTTGLPLNLSIAAGSSASFIFDTPKTYYYVCTQPGHQMRGKVTVQ